jgi:hypothetical protein
MSLKSPADPLDRQHGNDAGPDPRGTPGHLMTEGVNRNAIRRIARLGGGHFSYQVDRDVDVAAGDFGVRAQLVSGVYQTLSDCAVQTR